jgi:hypothetical protein
MLIVPQPLLHLRRGQGIPGVGAIDEVNVLAVAVEDEAGHQRRGGGVQAVDQFSRRLQFVQSAGQFIALFRGTGQGRSSNLRKSVLVTASR